MQKTLLSLFLTLGIIVGSHRLALSACAPLDVSLWEPDQRQFFRMTIAAVLGEPVDISWLVQEETVRVVRICAPTADPSTLDSASLQAQAQTLFVAQEALDTAKATETSEILTELRDSPLCRTATLAQLNARIDTELDTQKAAIQADIDAATNIATAKVAMTTMNTKLIATVKQTTKQLAKCMVGYMRLQQ